jgi:hypothetical protein
VDFWIQLKTYVQDITTGGRVKYGPRSNQLNRDDVIDSVTYADICASLFTNTPPTNTANDRSRVKKKFRYEMDSNYKLKLVRS